MASKRQYARSTLLWTASQAVHSRRHASQLSAENVHGEETQANDDSSNASVQPKGARKIRYILGSDALHKKYEMSAAEDFSNGISRYQVLFNDHGLWFSDKEGQPLIKLRRNIL